MTSYRKQHLDTLGWLTFCLCGGLIANALLGYGCVVVYTWVTR